MKVYTLQVSNVGLCRLVRGIIVALGTKRPKPPNTPSSQSTLDWSTSAFASFISVSCLLLPLFLSQLLVCGFSFSAASLDQIWLFVVKRRLHPVMFSLLLWLNLTLTSAFEEPTHLFSVLWCPRCGHQNSRCEATVVAVKTERVNIKCILFLSVRIEIKDTSLEVKLSVLVPTLICELLPS